jgi:hypothetical protein
MNMTLQGDALSVIRKRTNCRICGSENLKQFLSLGPTALANSFLRSEKDFENELLLTLNVYFCYDCSLVQLLDVVDPKVMFSNYLYVTGTSNTITAHNRDYAESVSQILNLKQHDLVVEIASNNGQLLDGFRNRGFRTLGIEPAENIAAIANQHGIETLNEFFNSKVADQVLNSHGKAKAVIANNVLAHVDESRDFLTGCEMLIDDDGSVIIEVPYLAEFVDKVEFDTVYHEHLCYFSITSLSRLFTSVGLAITRVEDLPIHGGSIRVYASKIKTFREDAPEVQERIRNEREAGLSSFETFEKFAERTEMLRENLLSLLNRLKEQGNVIAGYGAPAKGNTLLNYCGIDGRLLDFTVDKNPLKVGLYSPGSHIPVLPVSAIAEKRPDLLLILAWNFADEIMLQQRGFAENGGRFIVPIPEPTII